MLANIKTIIFWVINVLLLSLRTDWPLRNINFSNCNGSFPFMYFPLPLSLPRLVLDTTLCDKVCQWLVTGRRFSQRIQVSSTNKTDSHYITEILLKVALSTISLNLTLRNIHIEVGQLCVRSFDTWIYLYFSKTKVVSSTRAHVDVYCIQFSVCQWLPIDLWFSLDILMSTTPQI